MTITLDEPVDGYIDFAAYGLEASSLRSLSALDALWRDALAAALAESPVAAEVGEFGTLSGDLVTALGEAAWQKRWVRTWCRLSGRGVSQSALLAFFFDVVGRCEFALLGGEGEVRRLALTLFSFLRRAVVAAISCAIEFGEAARDLEAGVPGELSALRWLHAQRADQQPVAVLSLSLLNPDAADTLSAGDLQSLPGLIAERLGPPLRQQDRLFAGRAGEWLLCLPGLQVMAQPALAATRVLRLFEEPLRLVSGRQVMLQAAVGAALMPEHADDGEALLQAARLARWSLCGSTERFAWFQPAFQEGWQARKALLASLREALAQETLTLYLQPQIRLDDDACFGAELLLRWQQPDGGWVAPQQLIELIEANGWRPLFTDWLIRAAMRMSQDLAAVGIDITLSLNLTAADLLDPDLPELFAQRLATWQVPAERFTLELTESMMMTDQARCLAVIRQLAEQGFRLALDDFGTGYSSLSYLAVLPVREIKIDRSFVTTMLDSADNLRVVQAIIDLARDLDMVPLAEGVEDAAQRAQLREMGCRAAQGFLYAAPMPFSAFVDWYAARRA